MGGEVEAIVKSVSTGAGAMIGYFFGEWSVMINLLLMLVIVDWVTGWAAAWINGELKSRTGYRGIARKVAIFVMVTIAHFIDKAVGDLHYFQDAVIFFYLANELLSVIENMGRMGVPMPKVLRHAVKIFESHSGEDEPNEDTNSSLNRSNPSSTTVTSTTNRQIESDTNGNVEPNDSHNNPSNPTADDKPKQDEDTTVTDELSPMTQAERDQQFVRKENTLENFIFPE
ncbi:hypothetical protein PaeCFBP13512_02620 [Paenibacillus sp. CFBP13512]|nr:hypothetical protein PaeCFBP13512_02620 [Paenibacillus sp. CFBP13512]